MINMFMGAARFFMGDFSAIGCVMMGICCTYLSVYCCAIYESGASASGIFDFSSTSAEGWFIGVSITVIQSAVTAIIINPALLMMIWAQGSDIISQYGQIPSRWARFIFLGVAVFVAIVVGWSIVWNSSLVNLLAINRFLGIDGILASDPMEGVFQMMILGGTEIFFTIAVYANLGGTIRNESTNRMRQAVTAGAAPRSGSIPRRPTGAGNIAPPPT